MAMTSPTTTWFASPTRSTVEELRRVAATVRTDAQLNLVLEAVPGFAAVVNENRQIVGANRRFLGTLGADAVDKILGKRPGEAVGCHVARDAPSGCGTGHACAWCGAAAMMEAWQRNEMVVAECHVPVDVDLGASLDLEVCVTPMRLRGDVLAVLAMRDVSGERRRRVLERVFFHDVMNTAGALLGLAHLLQESTNDDLKADLLMVVEQLVAEVRDQRELLSAEEGVLRPVPRSVRVEEITRRVASHHMRRETGESQGLKVWMEATGEVVTDPTLLQRVLGNLVKNALEASAHGLVKIAVKDEPEGVIWEVWNPGMMPAEVRKQVFLRSFSTKGVGRGVGTYSAKLLTETYLGGRIGFTTNEGGTMFFVRVPRIWCGRSTMMNG